MGADQSRSVGSDIVVVNEDTSPLKSESKVSRFELLIIKFS